MVPGCLMWLERVKGELLVGFEEFQAVFKDFQSISWVFKRLWKV